ncbi:hypothetical protein GGR55DRAFT_434637 [Xylaria sp. FL0064]|nr:hypothetical protein GGR55DRAFT_434637 [Xylaria sp. FL0064]
MVNFNTAIVTVNLSEPLELQRNWAWNADSCVRPNTEFDIPILCQVHRAENGTSLPSLGVEYDAFEKCCPVLADYTHKNQWISIIPCRQQFCFTNNEQLAMGFDECIYNAALDKLKDLNVTNATTTNAYRGRCEWINYDSLKKGIREPEDIDNAAPAQRLSSWILLATLTAAWLGTTAV